VKKRQYKEKGKGTGEKEPLKKKDCLPMKSELEDLLRRPRPGRERERLIWGNRGK